ncbi:response regulator [Leeuwenhoekiella sp. MAR_2009_132]|uniref:response regulator n=1 Tax=Leeuwenhoekiella sp. MAR_2009_132 TaxID=1392489 RepID=UPI0009DEDC0D|nr:response regulator [Leeuwenhoekiella sp. MAR_2009_132]
MSKIYFLLNFLQMPENLTTLNVLAVDDNKLNLLVLSQLLKLLGLSSDLAYGGAQAIEMANHKKYDLIFMDIHMPDVDGFMATEEIRKNNKDTVIFALSADTTKPTIKKGFLVGMNDYLTKPIGREGLLSILVAYFGDRITVSKN